MTTGKVKVLIADDEKHIRTLLATIIASLGAEVVALAENGEQAVAMFEQYKPNMVLLDINMPKMMGDEALRRIMTTSPNTLAIMLTAQDAVDSVTTCLDLGARNYILKSNSAEEILRLIRESWADYLNEIQQRELLK